MQGRARGRLEVPACRSIGAKVVAGTQRRQRKGVACPTRAVHGLSWALGSWSLRPFWQELADEVELAEPAERADPQISGAAAGLMSN